MVLMVPRFAPSAKYSAHTMNATQRGRLYWPKYKPRGRMNITVMETASQNGIVSLVLAVSI